MAILNAAAREIEAKLVYYGTAMGGKTTNLKVIHRLAEPEQKQKLVSLNTAGERTLFFDLLPFDLGRVLDWSIRLKLYTVPGQAEYAETRRVVLNASDAIVFVADSQPSRHEENVKSIGYLKKNLQQNQLDAGTIPLVFQYNKRDLPGALSSATLEADLNWRGAPFVAASALRGDGVLETFEGAAALLLRSLLERYGARGRAPMSLEQLRAVVHERLLPMYRRFDDWTETRLQKAAPSPRHIVINQPSGESAPPLVSQELGTALAAAAAPAQRDPTPIITGASTEDAAAKLRDALEQEIRLLNEMMDRDARLAAPARAPVAAALGGVLDPGRLSAALRLSNQAQGLDTAAAPLLDLAVELSGALAGSVLLMTQGEGALTEAARKGIVREPLNLTGALGGTPVSRSLSQASEPVFGSNLARAAACAPSDPAIAPLLALPLFMGKRRVGLLVLHAARNAPVLDDAHRAALELVASNLAMILVVRGLERRAAGPRRVSAPAAVEAPSLASVG